MICSHCGRFRFHDDGFEPIRQYVKNDDFQFRETFDEYRKRTDKPMLTEIRRKRSMFGLDPLDDSIVLMDLDTLFSLRPEDV